MESLDQAHDILVLVQLAHIQKIRTIDVVAAQRRREHFVRRWRSEFVADPVVHRDEPVLGHVQDLDEFLAHEVRYAHRQQRLLQPAAQKRVQPRDHQRRIEVRVPERHRPVHREDVVHRTQRWRREGRVQQLNAAAPDRHGQADGHADPAIAG